MKRGIIYFTLATALASSYLSCIWNIFFFSNSHTDTKRIECSSIPKTPTTYQKPQNILVTGGAGFIGMHTSVKLAALGHQVVALDSVNSYYSTQLKFRRIQILKDTGIVFVQADVCDASILNATMQKYQIDRVVHLAGQAGVRYSLEYPQEYIRNNIQCFVVLLETLVQLPKKQNALVYASSSSVYGLNPKIPFSEEVNTDRPNSLYAATKIADEVIASAYFNLYGIPSVGLRFFTVYGPWGRPDMAYYSFARKIENNESITIFDHGKSMRDYTYVDDIVKGIVSSVHTQFNSAEILNLGNNKPVSISTFVKTLERHMGRKAKIQYTDSAKGDVPRTFADISKARCLIGYNPVTEIDEGLKKFVEWFKKYGNN